MKGFAKFCTAMYFVLILAFGVFFGIYVMKQLGDDDNITGQILYSIGGVVISFVFTYFVVGKIIGKFTKSGAAFDVGIFFAQLILTVAVVVLALRSDWIFYSHHSSDDRPVKEKCSWCGKYDELTNGWCDNCRENAFGKDGWYNYQYKN